MLVSHSREIAAGLARLVGQIAGPHVTVRAAGGMPDGSLGTDGGEVLAALRTASAGAGTVVLVDLGSSVLSVRAAVAELTEEESERIGVADAPLVEGAVAAGVAASTGCTLAQAVEAAEGACNVAKL